MWRLAWVVLGVATAKDVKQGFHILLVRPLLLAFGQRFDRQNCVGKRLQDEVAVTSGDRCWLPPAAAFANTHFSWPFAAPARLFFLPGTMPGRSVFAVSWFSQIARSSIANTPGNAGVRRLKPSAHARTPFPSFKLTRSRLHFARLGATVRSRWLGRRSDFALQRKEPRESVPDGRHRDAARAPIPVRFKLARCEQGIQSRVADGEQGTSLARRDRQRLDIYAEVLICCCHDHP